MRRRFTVPLIVLAAALPWLWFLPEGPPTSQRAQLISVVDVVEEADWAGGFSGIDLAADGSTFHIVTDRGRMATGRLLRDQGQLSDVVFDKVQRFVDQSGEIMKFPSSDAEGLAVDAEGRVFVSFEHAHRVLAYDTWDANAHWPGYTRAWRALANNRGLEALAVTTDGTLLAIPEQINTGAQESLVYTRPPGGAWEQTITLPVDQGLAPVGADFGPDGRLYVLERGLYPFGFYSRVRAMSMRPDGMHDIETVLQTRLGRHGNLEGLAVWQDADGLVRLTMVSDNNFYPFMRAQIVEYVLEPGVALTPQ